MTREMDSPGTRIGGLIANMLAALGYFGATALAVPAALALIQAIGRAAFGDYPIADRTWAFDVIYIYVRISHHVFEDVSPIPFSDLAPVIQGVLIVVPNLALILLGAWSLLSLTKMALNR